MIFFFNYKKTRTKKLKLLKQPHKIGFFEKAFEKKNYGQDFADVYILNNELDTRRY